MGYTFKEPRDREIYHILAHPFSKHFLEKQAKTASPVSVSRSVRGDNVAIAVTDRGEGIAKADQERVFERFFRVDKARSRQTGGTGLGLAIVKHVAANHNGSIELWSKPGTGSTFTLQIPAHVESDDDIDSDDAGTAGSTRIGRREQGSRENGMEAKR